MYIISCNAHHLTFILSLGSLKLNETKNLYYNYLQVVHLRINLSQVNNI